MRFILLIFTVATMAVFVACQTASSSTITKLESKTGEVKQKSDESVRRSGSPAEGAQEHDGEDVERITVADAKKAVDAGEAIIVDSRSQDSYNNEHIKGSINIPTKEMEERYKELSKDKKIIVYCS